MLTGAFKVAPESQRSAGASAWIAPLSRCAATLTTDSRREEPAGAAGSARHADVPSTWPKVKSAVLVSPALRAEVAYRAMTTAGELRQASFKGVEE